MCLESRSDPPLLSQMHFQRQAVERVLQVDTGGELCSPCELSLLVGTLQTCRKIRTVQGLLTCASSPWFPFFPRPVHVCLAGPHTPLHASTCVPTLTPRRCTRHSLCCCEPHPNLLPGLPGVCLLQRGHHTCPPVPLTSRPHSQGPPGPSDILYEAGPLSLLGGSRTFEALHVALGGRAPHYPGWSLPPSLSGHGCFWTVWPLSCDTLSELSSCFLIFRFRFGVCPVQACVSSTWPSTRSWELGAEGRQCLVVVGWSLWEGACSLRCVHVLRLSAL